MIMSQLNEIGTLVVVVLKAQHLHQPSFYKQDPYGQASLGGLKKRTKVAPKGGQHPVWDEELRFPVLADVGKDKINRMLEVACYKEVQRGEDVLLGKGTVDIEETLKTGEFDDWVPLETAAGARGEVYLEMTYYANSPPPVMRRPSKLSPSDRLAHPAQGGHPPTAIPPAVSPQPGRSPLATERKSSQPPPGSGNQIPSSLIPALGPQSQGSRQPSPGAPVTTVKHRKDSLPPLPADDTPDVGSDKNPGFPVALQPGGRSGPRPMPAQNRSRVTSIGPSPPEPLPGQLSKQSLSDTPALRAVPPFTPAQTPAQSYSPETTPTTGQWPGLTPSIAVEEHPSQTSSPPLPSPLGPSQAYVQQAFIPVPAQGSSRTLSPFQSQPHQHYEVPLPHYQQYTQYLGGPATSQPLPSSQTYPQLHNTQPGQQQPLPPYSSQQPPYQPPLQHHPPYQQPYLPPPQQQYRPQHIPYVQTPHPLQVQQPYEQHNLPTLPSSNQPVATQQSPRPQTQSYQIPPPPSLVQSPTPQTYTQPYFSPPPPPPPLLPPPPPPPPLNQSRKGSSVSPPAVQPLKTPISSSVPSQGPIPSTTSLQTITPTAPTLQSSTTPSHSQVIPNDTPSAPADTRVILGQNQVEERQSMTERVTIAGAEVMTREAREVQEDAGKHQTTQEQNENVVNEEQRQVDTPKPIEGQGVEEERESEQRGEKEWHREEVHQEELMQQEEERTGEDKLQQGEELRGWEEERKRMEDERRRQAEEELRRKNEEESRQREEHRRREEEHRMEEERKRREEVERMKVEEEHRRREEERERREKEERRRREDERKRREEERIQHEREEAEHRRKIAEEETRRRRIEEAEAERKWQEELARIRARTEQEAADAAFARSQMEADEAERRRQEEADLAFLRRAQEEADREEMVARERTRQLEADMEVARREQAHEEELERRRQEEADRELARRLDMELNLGAESSLNGGDWSRRRRVAGAEGEIRR